MNKTIGSGLLVAGALSAVGVRSVHACEHGEDQTGVCNNTRDPSKPKRDMVVTDGQKLTLGGETLCTSPQATRRGPSPR